MSKLSTGRWIKISMMSLSVMTLSACGMGTANLRQDGGSLQPCTDGPHCVSSTSTEADRKVAPFTYQGSRASARLRLVGIIKSMPRSNLVTVKPDYIHATFTSAIFRFVDDVEFLLPENSHQIQVRSSSRIGYYDFGVNRDRVEKIRKAFDEGKNNAPDAS